MGRWKIEEENVFDTIPNQIVCSTNKQRWEKILCKNAIETKKFYILVASMIHKALLSTKQRSCWKGRIREKVVPILM